MLHILMIVFYSRTPTKNVLEIFQIRYGDLGFTVHKQKSVVVPTQQIIFVGFLICSVTMTVRLPPEKCTGMIELCKEILAAKKITIRKFAQLIGKCVSVEAVVRGGGGAGEGGKGI